MRFRHLRRGAAAAIATALLTPFLIAQTPPKTITVHLDPAKTEIHWTLSDVLHTVHGTFALKGGVIVFDPATGHADGEVIVQLDSGDSGNATRDRLMKEKILETATYPEAIFHPEKVSSAPKAGTEQPMTVTGNFTIHGKDHPLPLAMTVSMDEGGLVTAKTEFAVPYVAWGMKDPSTFVLRVEKQVIVDVTAEGTVDARNVRP